MEATALLPSPLTWANDLYPGGGGELRLAFLSLLIASIITGYYL